MTPEQWKAVEASLASPYGSADLMCDGRRVSAQVQEIKPLRWAVVVYVDGQWRGEWFRADPPRDEHRFMNPRSRVFYREAELKRLNKVFSAKQLKEMRAKVSRWFEPNFPSAKAFIRRVQAAANEIRLTDCSQAHIAALEAKTNAIASAVLMGQGRQVADVAKDTP